MGRAFAARQHHAANPVPEHLRAALLEIAHLPENRADEASVIALVALQPYLEEQRTRTKEQG
jgi:hypothetical protein